MKILLQACERLLSEWMVKWEGCFPRTEIVLGSLNLCGTQWALLKLIYQDRVDKLCGGLLKLYLKVFD